MLLFNILYSLCIHVGYASKKNEKLPQFSGRLGDSVSNVTLTNSSGATRTVYGIIMKSWGCDATCSTGCYTEPNLRVVLWVPVSNVTTSTTLSIGQNFLYNLLTVENNAYTGALASPCARILNTSVILGATYTTTPQGANSWTDNSNDVCIPVTAGNCSDSNATWNPTPSSAQWTLQ